MGDRGDSQKSLASRAGLSQRAVGDLLTYGKTHYKSPTLRTADAIADAFNLPLWVLLVPELDLDLMKSPALANLITNFRDAHWDGRLNITRIAESEVRYAVLARDRIPPPR